MLFSKKYPYCYKGIFKNCTIDPVKSNITMTIKSYIKSIPYFFKKNKKVNIDIQKNENINLIINSDSPKIIPMGHATVLILYKGLSFIFDPVFSTPSIFLKRYIPLLPSKDMLPKIDCVLISHNHPDHLDNKSLAFLNKKNRDIKCFVPLKNSHLIKGTGINDIVEKTWWESSTFIKNNVRVKITCLPAMHWSQNGYFDRNVSLWSSWMLQLDDFALYFAGDTAYGDHFKEIKNEFKNIDCAFLPIAPYEPIEMHTDSHMSPNDAYNSFIDLGSPVFIPIHWGVFDYGDESRDKPIKKIINLMKNNNYINKLKGLIIGKAISIKSFSDVNSKQVYKDSLDFSIDKMVC